MKTINPEKWFTIKDISIPTLNEVHIFFVNIENQTYDVYQYKDFQSKFDKNSSNPFMTAEKREKLVKREYFLRKILSEYLSISHIDVNFYYSEYGKPYLSNKLEDEILQFNVSNSFNYLVIGICYDNQIGIDIEKKRSSIDYNRLVKRFFSEKERKFFFSLNEKEKKELFFQWWTIKESVVKNLGTGMRVPPNRFLRS